jgi:hypothetical protein
VPGRAGRGPRRKLAKGPPKTEPGGPGRGPEFIVSEGKDEKAKHAVQKEDPAPPTVPGDPGNGPAF